jgi:uncharacterized protein
MVDATMQMIDVNTGGTRTGRQGPRAGRRCASGRGFEAAGEWPSGGGYLGLWMLLMLVLAGCGQSTPVAGREVAGVNEPSRAQPRLATMKVWLGVHELKAEVARTAREREVGMMYRTNVAEDEGMLFVFPRAGQVSFWMKNVPIPLSCAYIDPEGVILEIHELEPHNEKSVPAKSFQIQYVLEVAGGWFERHGVSTGTLVRTERGSMRETFWGRR